MGPRQAVILHQRSTVDKHDTQEFAIPLIPEMGSPQDRGPASKRKGQLGGKMEEEVVEAW